MGNIKNKLYKLLRWSEKYTKTDMVYFTKGGFWLTLGQGFILISSLLLNIIFANLISKETFGIYKYILSISSILGAISLTGLGTAFTRAIANNQNQSLKKVFWIQLRWGLGMFVITLIGATYYFIMQNNLLALSLIIIGIFSPISQSAGLFFNFLIGKKDFKRKAVYDVFYNIIPIIIIFIVLIFYKGPLVLIFTYFISYTGISLFFYVLTLKNYPDEPNSTVDLNTIKYGKHLSVMNILNIITSQVDKILIFHFMGPMQLATYTFALAPISQIRSFFSSLNVLSLPKFSEKEVGSIQKTLPKKIIKFTGIVLSIVLVYILLAPHIYKLLLPQYIDSIFYSQMYAFILVFFPQEIKNTVLVAHVRKRLLYISTISTPLIKIISLAIFLPLFGIKGAIAGLLISSFLNSILTSILFKKM